MIVQVPIRTGRGLNNREHWRERVRRVRDERFAVGLILNTCKGQCPAGPGWVVTLTRCAPSGGLDGDNLQGALKAVRDEVAEFLGVDDGSAVVVWTYDQRRAPWGVEIGIKNAKTDD